MRYLVVFLILTQLFGGCAKQTTPTGGPKDTDPPQLVRSTPANKQVNFNSQQIELTFNEFVQVNNPREQLVIIPTIGKKFEMTAKKNRVTIKLNSKLLDSTTYTINFRDAILDLSEKNPARNLKLAFSTGSYIDSLSVSGKVYMLLKNLPAENFTIVIVPVTDTFNIFNQAAQFFSLTDKKGNFSIDNLKPGTYRIYAFLDKNKNLKVDSRSEPFAFRSDTVNLYQSIKDLELSAVSLDMRPLLIISAKPVGNHFIIRLNKGFAACTLESSSLDHTLQFDYPEYSTIRVYNTLTDLDSLPVRSVFSDSISNTLDTVLYIKFNTLKMQKERFTVKANNLSYIEQRQLIRGELSANKPVRSVVYDSIYIRLDSLTTLPFTERDFTWNQTFTQAIINKQLSKPLDFAVPKSTKNPVAKQTQRAPGFDGRQQRPGTSQAPKPDPKKTVNQLVLSQGSILSVENDSLAFQSLPISVVRPETSALLMLELHGTGNTLTQLLDKDYKPVSESTSKKIRFENLTPGEYFVRIILDDNANNQWDPGNFYLNTQPEKIIFYTDDNNNNRINLKANWEVGPLLIHY